MKKNYEKFLESQEGKTQTIPLNGYRDTQGHHITYIVRWMKKGKKQKIWRIFGKDRYGILDIGKQTGRHNSKHKNYRGSHRLKNFFQVINENKDAPHSAAKKLQNYGKGRIKPDDIWVTFRQFARPNGAKTTELKWIQEYNLKHLDNPPLNRQIPKK